MNVTVIIALSCGVLACLVIALPRMRHTWRESNRPGDRSEPSPFFASMEEYDTWVEERRSTANPPRPRMTKEALEQQR